MARTDSKADAKAGRREGRRGQEARPPLPTPADLHRHAPGGSRLPLWMRGRASSSPCSSRSASACWSGTGLPHDPGRAARRHGRTGDHVAPARSAAPTSGWPASPASPGPCSRTSGAAGTSRTSPSQSTRAPGTWSSAPSAGRAWPWSPRVPRRGCSGSWTPSANASPGPRAERADHGHPRRGRRGAGALRRLNSTLMKSRPALTKTEVSQIIGRLRPSAPSARRSPRASTRPGCARTARASVDAERRERFPDSFVRGDVPVKCRRSTGSARTVRATPAAPACRTEQASVPPPGGSHAHRRHVRGVRLMARPRPAGSTPSWPSRPSGTPSRVSGRTSSAGSRRSGR